MARRLIVALLLAPTVASPLAPVIASPLAPVIASAQSARSDLAASRESLIRADQALAAVVAKAGLAQGIRTHGTTDIVYLHPNVPILAGREAVASYLAEPGLEDLELSWTPLHVEVSTDGTLGVSYGATGFREGDRDLRFGKYLSAWRFEEGVWRLAAHAQVAAFELAAPSVARPEFGDLPPGPATPFVEADRAFSALAGGSGAAEAFGRFAAHDAALIAANGPLQHGPDAVRSQMAGSAPGAHWAWGPVAAGASADGTLGFTVGEATVSSQGPDRMPAVYRSKYLSLWRMEQGKARFLADGGSGRPAP